MDLTMWQMILFVIAGGFLAAFVDSVVGGGGLISVPVLLMTGLPPHIALGTNKLGGTLSSLTSTLSFLKSGKIDLKLVRGLLPFTLVGAVAGTAALQKVPSDFLKPLVVVMLLAVTVYTLTRKSWGDVSTYRKLTAKSGFYMALAALGMGFYDGFFGPGTGSFLIFIFLMLGFDFVTGAGNAKVLNFGSNIASLSTFLFFGAVDFRYGIPMGLAMIAGSYVGSQVAIRKGAAYIRPLFIGMSVLLIGKQIWDLMHRG
ncbi:TSUP family transporter [Paenibacillus aurantius]|uniref:Probable membrane transporter protein n=1 Tax=Paenibacillus aurantius TaxID=2918900 RepID=A0AA96LBI5_9BACL|nr:TSUP family transporter [Paenibacillus aurantius]WNQ10869.1 TSUP family transporter [Paenibacillus aurantius]